MMNDRSSDYLELMHDDVVGDLVQVELDLPTDFGHSVHALE